MKFTCVDRLFFASGIAPDVINDPRNFLICPSLTKNSAAHVVVKAGSSSGCGSHPDLFMKQRGDDQRRLLRARSHVGSGYT